MMLDVEAIKGWTWQEVLRGKINSHRRNRHYNAKILGDELRARLGDRAAEWELLVEKEWQQEEQAWKQKLGNDPTRIDARAPERKQADEDFIRKSVPFFEPAHNMHRAEGEQEEIGVPVPAFGGNPSTLRQHSSSSSASTGAAR